MVGVFGVHAEELVANERIKGTEHGRKARAPENGNPLF
ncbi:hypothetical protein PT2222_340065 [Paraburkholderia tropica]